MQRFPAPSIRRAASALLMAAAVAFTAACGSDDPAPAAAANQAPVAHAGTAQSVRVGSTVTLDGRASRDPDGDVLAYAWTLASRPAGSAATVVDPAAASPRFTADAAGTYVASLVVHDGRRASAAATVSVTAADANAAPVAHAGPAQNALVGTLVRLDGRASGDADGDALRFAWTLDTRPAGSGAQLSGADTAMPSFTADVAGTYTASLVVHDGRQASAGATVNVVAAVARLSAEASPAAADFGAVPLGGASTRVVSLFNTGNRTLTFRAGHPRTDGGAWTVSGHTCGATLAPGAECRATVSFAPATATDQAGTLFFELLELAASPRVALRGQGDGSATASATVTPTAADFLAVPIGGRASRVFTLTNTGATVLSFASGQPATDGGVWSLGGRSCVGTLAPGASCQVTVNFEPNSTGRHDGFAYFYFNELPVGQGNPLAALTGTGEGEVTLGAAVTPAAFDFGEVPPGMTAERVFTVVNTGNGPLSFRAGSPRTQGDGWSLGGRSCAGTLPPAARCTVTVVFTPGAAGVFVGELAVEFNELPTGGADRRAMLTGTGR